LAFEPWEGDNPSDEICPCCGIQFGYDDFAGGSEAKRQGVYGSWREAWVAKGMPWTSRAERPPNDWNPGRQVERVRK
jgi:hypothetical protein